jgi:hypothetical protein
LGDPTEMVLTSEQRALVSTKHDELLFGMTAQTPTVIFSRVNCHSAAAQ